MLTSPAIVTRRTAWFPETATSTLPSASSARPEGKWKRAAAPCPSAKPPPHCPPACHHPERVIVGVRHDKLAVGHQHHASRRVEARSRALPVCKPLLAVARPRLTLCPPALGQLVALTHAARKLNTPGKSGALRRCARERFVGDVRADPRATSPTRWAAPHGQDLRGSPPALLSCARGGLPPRGMQPKCAWACVSAFRRRIACPIAPPVAPRPWAPGPACTCPARGRPQRPSPRASAAGRTAPCLWHTPARSAVEFRYTPAGRTRTGATRGYLFCST